jgi:hypothetical protein
MKDNQFCGLSAIFSICKLVYETIKHLNISLSLKVKTIGQISNRSENIDSNLNARFIR